MIQPEQNSLEINRDIKKLHPKLALILEELIDKAKEKNLRVALFEGYRHPDRQNYLYGIGRLPGRGEPGKTVTDAVAYESWHNYSLAFDLAFITTKNRFLWDVGQPKWAILGDLGEKLGLVWGGKRKNPDEDHFQLTGGMSVKEAYKILKEKGIAEVWKRI